MKHESKETILLELFGNEKKNIDGYLTHGVAKDKWEEKRRIDRLRTFVEELKPEEVQFVMINLASEMGKKCAKGGNI